MAASRDILERSTPLPDRVLRYDGRETGVVEVWDPAAPPSGTTVVLVHGGFWQPEYDRRHLRPLAAALTGEGHAVASLEYARAGMPGGGWPGTGTDVLAGIAAVRADDALPDRLVLVGHSAGGHLALWAASRPRGADTAAAKGVEMAAPFAGVVPLAGVVDLALAHRLHLGDDAVVDLMGALGDTAFADTALTDADPAQQRLLAPVVLIHGDHDAAVPLEVSLSYLASREPEDTACRLEVLPGVGHFELIDPDHPAYAVLVGAVTDLVVISRE